MQIKCALSKTFIRFDTDKYTKYFNFPKKLNKIIKAAFQINLYFIKSKTL